MPSTSASSSGLKALKTQTSARPAQNGSAVASSAPSAARSPNVDARSAHTTAAPDERQTQAASAASGTQQVSNDAASTSGGAGNSAAPAAAAGSVDRRSSRLTEREIQERLRQVTSPSDPTKLYTKLKKVGQGASGSVYVARINATGEKVAIKQMDLAQQPRKELIVNEILVMKESRHDNIVNFRDSFLVKGTDLWVVMDYMEGGALTDVIDNHALEEDQISSICKEVRFQKRSPPSGYS